MVRMRTYRYLAKGSLTQPIETPHLGDDKHGIYPAQYFVAVGRG